jgi:hypothetical protein
LGHRLLQPAKRTKKLRAPRWIVQARDFAPRAPLQMMSSMALSYREQPV